MSKLISTGAAPGKIELNQKDLREFTYNLFSGKVEEIDRIINVFDNSEVSGRHISVPVEWLKTSHTFSERNKIYKEMALSLSKSAIEECMKRAETNYSDIDCIIFVSSTGISTPTIDALLFNELKLNSHIKRIPIWGLGCAGGAVGISRAMDFTKAYPDKNVLIVALELCSLTFQKDDISKSNIVACSLFSDGAAAAFVCGRNTRFNSLKGISLIDSLSTIYEDSLDVMGWDIVDDGFKVIFSRDIPSIVRDLVKPNIDELLSIHNLKKEDIKHYVTHPGGLKVIKAYEESLGLNCSSLTNSRKILNEYGNMSSPTVLFVLNELIRGKEYSSGERGIISALGPGFSSELVLFETE